MALPFSGYAKSARALATVTDAALIADISARMTALGWTVVADADTFGIACYAPGLSGDLAIIFAIKDASVGTPTMLAPDTATTGILMVGMVKAPPASGGATLDWDAASPLGSGTFSGYARGLATTGSTRMTIFASEEACCVMLDNDTNSTLKYILAGAWIDPLSTEVADCETNGRVYAMSMSGGVATTGIALTLWSSSQSASATNNNCIVHGTSAGNAHSVAFVPRNSTTRTFTNPQPNALSTLTASVLETTGNVRPIWPLPLVGISVTDCIGYMRDMGVGQFARHAETKQYDVAGVATDAVHYMGSGFSSDGITLAFKADNF